MLKVCILNSVMNVLRTLVSRLVYTRVVFNDYQRRAVVDKFIIVAICMLSCADLPRLVVV